MKGLLRDLASQISGEVTASEQAREYFSTDGSIFTIKPQMIIYPRDEMDVINSVKFLNWQAQEGKVVSLTARGKGTDQSGGALGNGAILVFPAHMKALVDIGKNSVTVQPGMPYATLQTVLHSHLHYLPPYPASIDFSSIGGAVANNAAGEKSVKYGTTRHWVEGLRVVLSNGDVIETFRLSKKQLRKKKQQPNFEGHLYRELDRIITDHQAEITASKPKVSKNSAGYDIWDVKGKDGSFDLSQLIVGSQGTLGVVTQATFRTAPFNPEVMLMAGYFDDIHKASEAVQHLLKLNPSALEVVDRNLLEFLQKNKPESLKGLVSEEDIPEIILLCELDDLKPGTRKRKSKQAMRILEHYATSSRVAINKQQQDDLWRVRRGAAAVIWKVDGPKKALPIIEDGIVPSDKLTEFLKDAYELFKKEKINVAVWGHAGNGHFHIQPFMDLKNLRDRAKVFDLSDKFYALIKKYGGSNSGEHNDGIMRGVYLKEMFGDKIYGIFEEIKDLFDPLGFLNPGVKMDVTRQDAMVKMRKEYSMKHLDDHMPGSYNH